MGLGAKIRLSRIFSNPSGNLFGGAVDHFVGYGNVREGGLADLPGALKRVMAGGPDYVSIQPGAAGICGRTMPARRRWSFRPAASPPTTASAS